MEFSEEEILIIQCKGFPRAMKIVKALEFERKYFSSKSLQLPFN